MTRTELIQLIQDTTGAVAFKDVQDVPSWWRDEIQNLLDADAINGGTPREKDDDDVNLTYTEAKICAIMARYVDYKMDALDKKLETILKKLEGV